MRILIQLLAVFIIVVHNPCYLYSCSQSVQVRSVIYCNTYGDIYCQSSNGVNLRESYSIESRVVSKIGFGNKVTIISESSYPDKVNGQHGHWLEVSYKDKEGYVFSPFFGHIELRQPYENEWLSDYVLSFLDMVISDSVLHSFEIIESEYRGYSDIMNYNLYKCGAISYLHNGYESANVTFVLDEIDPNQIHNLLKVYHAFGDYDSNQEYPQFKDKPVTKDYPVLQESFYRATDCMVFCTKSNNRTEVSIYYNDYPERISWADLMPSNTKIIDIIRCSNNEIANKKIHYVDRYEFLKIGSFYYKLTAVVNFKGNEFRSILPVEISKNSVDDLSSIYQMIDKDDLENLDNHSGLPDNLFRIKDRNDKVLIVYFDGGWKHVK